MYEHCHASGHAFSHQFVDRRFVALRAVHFFLSSWGQYLATSRFTVIGLSSLNGQRFPSPGGCVGAVADALGVPVPQRAIRMCDDLRHVRVGEITADTLDIGRIRCRVGAHNFPCNPGSEELGGVSAAQLGISCGEVRMQRPGLAFICGLAAGGRRPRFAPSDSPLSPAGVCVADHPQFLPDGSRCSAGPARGSRPVSRRTSC